MIEPQLNEDHLDFLTELLTIGAGKGSEILSEMLDTYIQLTIPSIKQLKIIEIDDHIPRYLENRLSVVDLRFMGDLHGESKLILPISSARKLGSIILEETEDEDFDSAKIGVITEIGNIILNSIMGTISNFLEIRFDYQIPVYQNQFKSENDKALGSDVMVLLANTQFKAEEVSIEGGIALLLSLDSMGDLISMIDRHLANV